MRFVGTFATSKMFRQVCYLLVLFQVVLGSPLTPIENNETLTREPRHLHKHHKHLGGGGFGFFNGPAPIFGGNYGHPPSQNYGGFGAAQAQAQAQAHGGSAQAQAQSQSAVFQGPFGSFALSQSQSQSQAGGRGYGDYGRNRYGGGFGSYDDY